MKKLSVIILVFMASLVVAQDVNTQNTKEYKNIFRFGPFNFFDRTLSLSYERLTNNNTGIYFNMGILYQDLNGNYGYGTKDESSLSGEVDNYRAGYKAEFQYKFYVFNQIKETQKRIYFSPYVYYNYTEIKETNYGYYDELGLWVNHKPPISKFFYFNTLSAGMLVGFNWTLAKRINIDAYVGGGLRRTFDNYDSYQDGYYFDSGIWEPGYNGIAPKVGFDIGFNF